MSLEIIFVFFLLAAALFLFSTRYVSFDIVALIIMAALMATGILDPKEGLAGFSNPATLTIAAMFILSESLRKTGLLNTIGNFFTKRIEQNYWRGLFMLLFFISLCSAFINNTAVVVIFIPVMINMAKQIEVSPSKLLMPLSFAGIFGGICTLIGTSTNILVSSIAEDTGLASFSMFEFLPMGLLFLVAGFMYLFTIGIRKIPERRKNEDLSTGYEIKEFLTSVVVDMDSKLIGEKLNRKELSKKLDMDVLYTYKPDTDSPGGHSSMKIDAGDVIRVRGKAAEIDNLLKNQHLSIKPMKEGPDTDLQQNSNALVEAVVAPDSPIEGKMFETINLKERFGALSLAVRHQGDIQQEKLEQLRLTGGDSLLLSMDKDRINEIDRDRSFVLASQVGITRFQKGKVYYALPILLGVVVVTALDIIPIVVSAIIGAILMILTGCINTEEAYNAVNWKVIMLLAGVIPLGTAMKKTGAATLLADQMIFLLSDMGPRAVMSGFFLLTMGITAVMSNNASAALFAPIAIETANTLDVNTFPFLFAVTFAASLSFITPFGYQTNTLIYGAGHYRFSDFTKIGLPLNIIFWILGTIFIPIIWPF